MRYIGGKARTARRIADAVLARTDARGRYVEPFVGGGAVASVLAPEFEEAVLSDAHPDLVALLAAVAGGWEPPEWVTREEYEALRDAPTSALRGFAGFAVSYNGKWWGGYGPEARSAGRNYVAEARRSLLKRAPGLAGATFLHRSYLDVEVLPGDVVYCDPPYAGTMGYPGTPPFDHVTFWETVADWADLGAHVFVSEYEAPEGWGPVFEVQRTATVDAASSVRSRREGLFVRGVSS